MNSSSPEASRPTSGGSLAGRDLAFPMNELANALSSHSRDSGQQTVGGDEPLDMLRRCR